MSYLSSIAIPTTTKDQTHAPCAGPKTNPLQESKPFYIADNQPFDCTNLV